MSFTPRNIQQQNAERRLRHATWVDREPIPMWAWMLAAVFLSPFVAAFLSWSAQ